MDMRQQREQSSRGYVHKYGHKDGHTNGRESSYWFRKILLPLLLVMALSANAMLPHALDDSALSASDIVIQSTQFSDRVEGGLQVSLAFPQTQLRELLVSRAALCDIAIIHFNIKSCLYLDGETSDVAISDAEPKPLLRIFGARKDYQSPEDSGFFDFHYQLKEDSPERTVVDIHGDQGPFGTLDYRIRLEAIADGAGSTLNITFSVSYSQVTHWVQRLYFSSIARNKIGFSSPASGRQADDYVRGLWAMIERNVMRLFLSLQVALEKPPEADLDARLHRWFELTEQYPRQLREMDLESYLDSKRREVANQRRLQQDYRREKGQ